MKKQRTPEEVRENRIAVAYFIAALPIPDYETQCAALKEAHRVGRGEIGSETCIRNMKTILKSRGASVDPV